MTAGLSSAPACVRVIIRDVAGKHSWDSAVLYGPPSCFLTSPAHTQSPYSTTLHSCTPPGGLQQKMEVKREAREEVGAGGIEADMQEFQGEGEVEVEEMKASEKDEDERRDGGDGWAVEEGGQEEDARTENRIDGELSSDLLTPPLAKRVCQEVVPTWDSLREGDDTLDEMLQYLGYSSPECLQRAGICFNNKPFFNKSLKNIITCPLKLHVKII